MIHRSVLFLQRAVAACAVADGPGAPIAEYCVHFVLDADGHRRPHTLSYTQVSCMPSSARLLPSFFSILRALRARVERAAALDSDRGVQRYM
jgi:hypothetical protein